MSQVVKPVKGEIYIAKLKSSELVWIFKSEYHEECGNYTEFMEAYCYDCNNNRYFRERFVSNPGTLVSDNADIKWMRLASNRERKLFQMIYEASGYS